MNPARDQAGAVATTLLRPETYLRTPWKNGGGVTVDIAGLYRPGHEVGGWAGTVWRLGRTVISAPGPFSDLSGFDRLQAVIRGGGLVLRVEDGTSVDLRQPFRTVRYPGEWVITTELEDGAVEVLNLIGRRDAVALDLRFVEGPAEIAAEPGEHVVYAPGGPAMLRLDGAPLRLEADHAAQLDISEPVGLAVESGTVALATIRPRSTPSTSRHGSCDPAAIPEA